MKQVNTFYIVLCVLSFGVLLVIEVLLEQAQHNELQKSSASIRSLDDFKNKRLKVAEEVARFERYKKLYILPQKAAA